MPRTLRSGSRRSCDNAVTARGGRLGEAGAARRMSSCGGARWERRGSRRCCEAAPACGGLPSPSARVARAAGKGSTSDAEARRDEEHELKEAPAAPGSDFRV
jgi:hypothetical protein